MIDTKGITLGKTDATKEGGCLSFGAYRGQVVNLYRTGYGIGIQDGTQYFRTDKNFAWYKGGNHNDGELNHGGGAVQMVIKDGYVGIGTSTPADALEVAGNLQILTGTGSNPIRFTSTWSDFSNLTDAFTNRAEISNDTKDYKTLMIVGNKSNDQNTRRVSVWDRLEVNGQMSATKDIICEGRVYAKGGLRFYWIDGWRVLDNRAGLVG